ncbi:hypothetical protein FJZ48_01940 [Candidatus Uhrbacteria bacterium]|nr:hypothetical protein [Candidatus Uhrbacteria bacterium]
MHWYQVARSKYQAFLIFILGLIWFSLFQPWSGFVDPDAFYHAKITSIQSALLITSHPLQLPPYRGVAPTGLYALRQGEGPYSLLHDFPWLDLTSLHTHFVDQHFLFHILLIPFQSALGVIHGTQVAAVVFSSTLLFVFYLILKRCHFRYPFFWTTLLALTPGLLFRLSLDKASPLALLFFLFGLAALVLRKPLWACIAGLLFALTHGGWIILFLAYAVYFFGEWLFEMMVEGRSWKMLFRSDRWQVIVSGVLGTALAILLHPNTKNILSFLWVQVFKIGVGTPFGRVFLGGEWLPPTFYQLTNGAGILVFIGVLLGAGMAIWKKSELNLSHARQSIGLAFVVAVLFALTLKSHRFVEYLVPVTVWWFASLASIVDFPRAWSTIRQTRWRWGVLVLGLSFLFIAGLQLAHTWKLLHSRVRRLEDFAPAVQAIAQQANPGERVFHSNWDQFPQLFMLSDQLRYVAGVDPTFLLEENPELSDLYRDITLGRKTDNVVNTIRDQFGARFVLIELAGHESFDHVLQQSTHVTLIHEDPRVRVYRIF